MKKTINFMGVRNIAFAITALLTVLALFSWFYKGLNFGLDFTGGTLIELRYEQPADLGKIRQELQGAGFGEAWCRVSAPPPMCWYGCRVTTRSWVSR